VVQLKQWQAELEDYHNQLTVVENELRKIDKVAARWVIVLGWVTVFHTSENNIMMFHEINSSTNASILQFN